MGSNFRMNLSYSTTMIAFGLSLVSLSTIYALRNYNNNNIVSAESTNNTNKCKEWNYKWDDRKLNSPNNSIRNFTLIRHGQYVHDMDPSKKVLTKLGKDQAKITGQKLKSMGIKYDEIICSEMVRAKETADIITNELFSNESNENKVNIKYDSNLNEGCPSKVIPVRNDLNKSGFFDDLDQDSLRIKKAFESYIHRNDTENDQQILIIGHGNVFRYFICRVLQIDNEAWLRFSICNCGITKFKVFGDGRISMQCIGSDGHFQSDLVTFN